MGGWRNWRQNLLAGPPIPAPPAFTGLALAGLGALLLMKRRRKHG
jgi:LPXTG-motif cell wall-anchored protein